MVMFHSYVKLPEGIYIYKCNLIWNPVLGTYVTKWKSEPPCTWWSTLQRILPVGVCPCISSLKMSNLFWLCRLQNRPEVPWETVPIDLQSWDYLLPPMRRSDHYFQAWYSYSSRDWSHPWMIQVAMIDSSNFLRNVNPNKPLGCAIGCNWGETILVANCHCLRIPGYPPN